MMKSPVYYLILFMGYFIAAFVGIRVTCWMLPEKGVKLDNFEFLEGVDLDYIASAKGLAWNEDGTLLAAPGDNETVYIYDVSTPYDIDSTEEVLYKLEKEEGEWQVLEVEGVVPE